MKKFIREWRERVWVKPLGVAMLGVRLRPRICRIIEGGAAMRVSRARVAGIVFACAAICASFATTTLTRAQLNPLRGSQDANDSPLPVFEVASVKPTPSDNREVGTFLTYPGGRIEARGCTLTYLIMLAYNVQHFQISGGEPWADDYNTRFSISARPPADSASTKINPSNPKLPPPQEERLMLRSLLADRFQVALKQSTRDVSGFALVLKDRNPKLSEPKDAQTFPVVLIGYTDDPQSPWYLQGVNAPMTKFADRLAGMLSVPVVDRTGLPGSYDFVVKYANGMDENASAPLLKDAIQQIGLKLEPAKVSALYLEIKHASKPTPN